MPHQADQTITLKCDPSRLNPKVTGNAINRSFKFTAADDAAQGILLADRVQRLQFPVMEDPAVRKPFSAS